jgi:hypothetical protein
MGIMEKHDFFKRKWSKMSTHGPVLSKTRLMRLLFGALMIIAIGTPIGCAQAPVKLEYRPSAGMTKPHQYASSLRFGVVLFKDDRASTLMTGDRQYIGWGTNTYRTDSDVDLHVTKAFVDQFNYLGLKSTLIHHPPADFSFQTNGWVQTLRSRFPNVDVFIVGRIMNYQFQSSHTGYIEGTGSAISKDQVELDVYFINAQTGHPIWGTRIHERSMTKSQHSKPLEVAAERLDRDLQKVILGYADRSVGHLAKVFPGSIQVEASANPATVSGKTLSADQYNLQKNPIPAGKGRLVVTTTPSGAKVYIDNVFYGVTPMMLDLDPGVHLLKVKMNQYHTSRDKIGILGGTMTPWQEDLQKKF